MNGDLGTVEGLSPKMGMNEKNSLQKSKVLKHALLLNQLNKVRTGTAV